MVVWVFAGGGESEVNGLIPHFLEKQFPDCQFDRKTPILNRPVSENQEYLMDMVKLGKVWLCKLKNVCNRL